MYTFKQYIINEYVSSEELKEVESFLDKLVRKLGIDKTLITKHFKERINDPRNRPDITKSELISIFKKLFRSHKKDLEDFKLGDEAVISDLTNDLHIPFSIRKKYEGKGIVFSLMTILRKQNFFVKGKNIKVA